MTTGLSWSMKRCFLGWLKHLISEELLSHQQVLMSIIYYSYCKKTKQLLYLCCIYQFLFNRLVIFWRRRECWRNWSLTSCNPYCSCQWYVNDRIQFYTRKRYNNLTRNISSHASSILSLQVIFVNINSNHRRYHINYGIKCTIPNMELVEILEKVHTCLSKWIHNSGELSENDTYLGLLRYSWNMCLGLPLT